MGRCKDCGKWVGKSSQSNGRENRPCFFKVLIGNFSKKLWIPPRFAEYLITGGATLRGPSGNIWNVRVKRKDKRFFFGKGWENFARHHQLNTADFLMFRYDGVLEFNVLIFDRSGCLREDSFFAKNMENADENEEQNKRQNALKSFVEVIAQPCAASNGASKNAHVDYISVETGETSSQQMQGKLSKFSSKVIPKPDETGEEACSVIQPVHLDTELNLLSSDIYFHLIQQPKRSCCRKPASHIYQRCNENEKAAKFDSRYASGAEVCWQKQAGTSSLSKRRRATT